MGQEDDWAQASGVRKTKKGSRAIGGQGLEERWEEREQSGGIRGAQGVLQIHLSPGDSLVFARGRLVINRLRSACLTGGSLKFDGRTLILQENSRKTDGVTNRRISQKTSARV